MKFSVVLVDPFLGIETHFVTYESSWKKSFRTAYEMFGMDVALEWLYEFPDSWDKVEEEFNTYTGDIFFSFLEIYN